MLTPGRPRVRLPAWMTFSGKVFCDSDPIGRGVSFCRGSAQCRARDKNAASAWGPVETDRLPQASFPIELPSVLPRRNLSSFPSLVGRIEKEQNRSYPYGITEVRCP